MKSLKPIRWKEGMFLRPHHLQQFELFLESRESERLSAIENHDWGIVHVKIRKEPLDNFTLDVGELVAVLPDGTLIDVPGNARLSSRPFQPFMTEAGKPLDVWIGVRAREERRGQVQQGTSGTQSAARYLPVEAEVYDQDAGEGRAPIELLELDVRYFFGEESQQGYDCIPLTRVVGTGDPAKPVTIDDTFAAPSLTLQGSPALHDCARKIQEIIARTVRELGALRASADIDHLILYQAVSACQPVLRDMIHDGRVHPRTVYHELARLAGALHYRDKGGRSADDIPPYDHRKPGPVFEFLRTRIDELSALAIRRRFKSFPMERIGDDFRLDLPEEARRPGSRCYLEVHADQSTPQLRTLLMTAKVSSQEQIAALRSYALPGVPTEAMPDPPPEVGVGATGTFFRLKQEHDDWAGQVLRSGDLTVSILNAPSDIEIKLVVIPPDA